MPRGVLLGLLGAAALAAVGSIPLDNKNHNEEMVTRCIIEVLSNALSKPSIPTISPECRQVLKKSEKEVNEEEKSDNGNTKFEVRLLRGPAGAHQPSGPEEAAVPGQTKASSEKWEGADEPREGLRPNAQVSKEARPQQAEKSQGEEREEERGENPPNGERGTAAAAAERLLAERGQARTPVPSRRTPAAPNPKEEPAAAEKTHSKESAGDPGSQEDPQDLSSRSWSQEDSAESEEDPSSDAAKRRARPRHHHARSRADRAPQEGTPPAGARRSVPGESEQEAGAGAGGAGGERGHSPAPLRASEEEPEPGDDGSRSLDLGPRSGGGGNEGGRVPRPQNGESQEEGDERDRPSSELEHWADRYGDESERRGPEGARGRPYRARGGGPRRGQAGSPPSRWRERERRYPSYGEDAAPGAGREDLPYPRDLEEEARPPGEKRKRLGVLFDPYFDPRQWKSRDVEKKDAAYDGFSEGEDEDGLSAAERAFFPGYSYEWWERPPSEDVDWGYEKRGSAAQRTGAVAELDQLLHYRKKSAEFPDFYDPEAQRPQPRAADEDGDAGGQGALTEEEEKELENLAAMDLELQKIAEKLSQRG